MTAAAPLTLGTAGHVDHGKTALVRALTGKNTDRLPDEHRRGMSIDLGYAPLELPSGRRLSVVDVPGHERLVRTMVAGATGIDLFLLCVAADDGVMPQTREHLAVLRALGVERGVVAVTKADAAPPASAAAQAAELVPRCEVVAVSALERRGLEELRAALARCVGGVSSRAAAPGPGRLHVDRSFTLRGAGTVVTGTLWAGRVAAGDRVTVLPRGVEARVRGVHVHDEPVQSAAAGQRVALNLAGVGWRELRRGDVVCGMGPAPRPTYLVDAALALEPGARPLRSSERVHVHHGTREAPARVVPLGDGLAQLRLESPLVPAAGDRLVLRRVAPPDTIGGGTVIDPAPRKHGPGVAVLSRLRALARGETAPPGDPSPPLDDAPAGQPPPELDPAALRLGELLRADGTEPRADGDLSAAAGIAASEAQPRLRALVAAGQAVRVGRNLHFAPAPLADLVARVVAICERDGRTSIAAVRDELGTSRRYAQALLEHMDAEKITRRRGDEHVLRRRSVSAASEPAAGGPSR